MSVVRSAKVRWQRISPRAHDLGFIALSMAVVAAEALGHRHRLDLSALLVAVAGTLGAAALWWRRRAPVTITALGIVLFVCTRLPTMLGIGLFTVAIRRRDRVLVGLSVASAVALALPPIIDNPGNAAGEAVSAALQVGFFVAAGSYIGARRDLLGSLRERAMRAEAERELRGDQARLEERARIAREMHDVLAHKVSLIALHAGALEVNPTADARRVQETAALIRTTAREAMDDLRDVLGVLRNSDAVADGSDLAAPRAADIARVVDASRAAGVQTELSMAVAELPDELARTAYRIVREGLTNVHKHARGAATSVVVSGDEHDGVTIVVTNQRPVAGDSLLPGSGSGLVGLRERVALLGGSLRSGQQPDGGWQLRVWLPWRLTEPAR